MSTRSLGNVRAGTFNVVDSTDESKKINFVVSGVSSGVTRTVTWPDSNMIPVGTALTQTLTAKTIDASNNTLTNIGNSSIVAGVDAAKIANGTVSNAQFQYLSGATSNIQTQLGGKASTVHSHLASDITNFDTAADARISAQKGQALGLATLDGSGKVPASQLSLTGVTYQGTWNATTNTPTLASNVGVTGYYYVVSVSGTTAINGINDWQVGDWIIFNGSVWQKSDNSESVTSVAGKQGAVILDASDIASGTFANARIAQSNVTQHVAALNIQSLLNAPAGTVIGTSDVQTLTNKTINASANTISNIGDSQMTTGINANKIANGTVSNTTYQYLSSVTSDIQTQLDSKATQAVSGYVENTVTTNSGTSAVIATISTTNNTTYVLQVTIVARRTDAGNESAGYVFNDLFRNNTNALTKVTEDKLSMEDALPWDVSITVSGTNILINVIGEASKTINWKSSHKVLAV